MDVHEHCHRLLNYDPARNVVFCSKCKTEWGEPVRVVLLPTVVQAVVDAVEAQVAQPAKPKRRRK